jgi:hypothetical protein
MKILGLPEDVIELVSIWLKKRFYFVSIDGINSTLYEILLGTVQGLFLGSIIYAVFVAPLFRIKHLHAFADDNFIPRVGDCLTKLITDMEKSLEAISKWL